jgi:hypothetical protein
VSPSATIADSRPSTCHVEDAVIIELILVVLVPPLLIAVVLGLERVESGLGRSGPRRSRPPSPGPRLAGTDRVDR